MRPRNHHLSGSGRRHDSAADAVARETRGASPAEIPERMCKVAVELLPVTGASVSLHCDGLPIRLGASSAQAAYVTELQATLGDGPCRSAVQSGAPVLACDLTRGRDVWRWPVFAKEATGVGVRAMYSIPLGTDAVCVGTLDLYRDTPGGLTDDELRTARAVAGVTTAALMALPRDEDEDETAGPGGRRWMGGLTADHDEVYQATGMIMAQLGIGADEALTRLRAHAFAYGRTALEVARDVVERRRPFDEDRDLGGA